MSKLSKAQQKELARIYYVQNGLTAKETAAKVGVSENTLTKWVNDMGWKSLKVAEISKKENLIAALEDDILRIRELAKEENRPLNSAEADSIYKTSLTIRNLSKDFGIDVYNAVLQEFFNYSREVDLPFMQRGVDIVDQFMVMKIKQRA
jgi:transposase